MTLTIITSQGDVAETRYHLDRQAVSHTLRGVPEWIVDRPHQGGSHSVETCERCRNAKRLRALFADSSVSECAVMRAEDREQTLRQASEYVADSDHRRNVTRRCLYYWRIATRTPEAKLPATIRELRIVAATHKVHMTVGNGAGSHTLWMWAQAAADEAWERYRLAYHAS